MSVHLSFECDGCEATVERLGPIRKEFTSVSGRSWGFGSWRYEQTPDDFAPEGWVASDPYTACCYCPKCWDGIMSSPANATSDINGPNAAENPDAGENG